MPKFSVETEIDKLVCNIAEAQARCTMKVNRGVCDANDCVDCQVRHDIDVAVANLSAGDSLAIHNRTEDILMAATASSARRKREITQTAGGIIKDVFKVIGLIFLVAIIIPLALVVFFVRATPYDYEDNDYVIPVLRATSKNVCDIDGDNLVNCCDYTIIFKVMWDYMYEDHANDCEIVRNWNPYSGMNHLFIRCRLNYTSSWIYIEPQAYPVKYTDSFLMKNYWGDKYNPIFNHYGETKLWLATVKVRE